MRAYPRIVLLLVLLAAMVLSGCGGKTPQQLAATVEQLATQVPQQVETKLAPTAASTPTEAPTEVPPEPTETPEPPTPVGSSTWQTITQQVGVTQSDSGTFTVTESINLGDVDGIQYTSESVAMPAGATPYDGAHLPQVGDAVRHPSGLIVQLKSVKTVDVDDENEFIVVDVVVGNDSKERQLIAVDPLMEIVSGDGHWYSAYWYMMYWGLSGSEQYMQEQQARLHQKLIDHGLTTYFSAPLEPGEAAAGTAAFLVPKSATELAFGFQPWEQAIWLLFANDYSPTVFFPLGIRGDFPALPADADPVEAGRAYKVGEAFAAPKRGLALEVYSAWRQPGPLNAMQPLPEGEQYVVVSLMVPLQESAKPLDAREVSLVGGSGEVYELQEYTVDWLTCKLGPYTQRGVLVFKGPADAQGLMLKFDPIDPATLESSPILLEDEAATVELGELGEEPVAPLPVSAPEPGEAEPTPTAQPTGNAQMGDKVVLGKLAVTLNGWQTDGGPEDFQAEGKTWLMVDVTVENVSTEDVSMYPEEFSFVDRSGVVYDSLLNKPSAWDDIRDYILEYATLAPWAKIENKWLVIQVPDSALSGLQMRHEKDDGSVVLWDLGL